MIEITFFFLQSSYVIMQLFYICSLKHQNYLFLQWCCEMKAVLMSEFGSGLIFTKLGSS